MERKQTDPRLIRPSFQGSLGPADLLDSRQERQEIPFVVRLRCGLLDGRGDMIGDALRSLHAPRRPDVANGDRESVSRHPDDRGVVEVARHRLGVHRRRHRDDDQVVADRVENLAEQSQRQVGVQAPLVKLIEDHRADPFEKWVGDQ